MKTVSFIQRNAGGHWVGDGFPVRNMFSYNDRPERFSPFLMLDYGGPTRFEPTTKQRGVGQHPHRGFETVTIVYDGEVSHRDSSGGGGTIGPGEVQWMTAAAGIVHEEYHGERYAKEGGPFEMVQLWVNLPAKDKMTAPRYQGILNNDIPKVTLPNEQGSVRVIAGEFADEKGPAKTYTPIHVWDLQLSSDQPVEFTVPEGFTAMLVVLKGQVFVHDSDVITEAEVGVLDRSGDTLRIDRAEDAKALLLMGEVIAEPIVGRGPFVMNTMQEIHQAIEDYHDGKIGHLS